MKRVLHSIARAVPAAFLAAAGVVFAQSFSPGEVRVSSSSYIPPQTAIRLNPNEVQVEVVVRDTKGMPIGGLTQEQFQLLDKDQTRKLTRFTAEARSSPSNPRPRSIALFFDDIHTPAGDFHNAQIAAQRLVNEAMSPGDRLGVFTASSTTTLGFTVDKTKLQETIETLRARATTSQDDGAQCARITPYQALQIVREDLAATQAVYSQVSNCRDTARGATPSLTNPTMVYDPRFTFSPDVNSDPALKDVRTRASIIWRHAKAESRTTLEAIRTAASKLAAMDGDHILVLVSSGFLSQELESDQEAVIALALRDRIVINSLDAKGHYASGPAGRLPSAAQPRTPPPSVILETTRSSERAEANDVSMLDLAFSTGGLFLRNDNDLDFGIHQAGVAPAFSYQLSFSLEDVSPDGSYHSLKVKLDRPESLLEYRPGYYAPKAPAAAAEAQAHAGDKLDQAVASQDNLSEIPATLSTKPAKSASGAQELAVTIHVDIRSLPFEKKDDRQLERLDLVVALFDSQNNFVAGKRGEFDLALKSESLTRLESTGINGTLSITAPPGAYRLRAVAQEAITGKTAAMSQPVQVQ